MKCTSCGRENEENAKFCESCGSLLETTEKKPNNRMKGKVKYVVVAVILLIAIAIGLYFAMNGTSGKSYTDKIAMADKYLEKKDYKKAEEVYLEAIEIDPKNPEPYIKLSDVYIADNQKPKAEAILKQAEEKVESNEGKKQITEKKEEISNLVSKRVIQHIF